MAEESEKKKENKDTILTENEDNDIESHIQIAMRSRLSYFKQQSDSLTFEGVRRLLEKDLGFQEYAFDVHKAFIKQCLLKCLEEVGDDAQNVEQEEEKDASTQETENPKEECQSTDEKDGCSEDEDKMEDSPVLGLLKEQKGVKLETKEVKDNERKVVPSETVIKKAVRKRASYIKANAEKITMAGLRRLLEEDLKLDKFTLDLYKKLISQQLDEVISSSEVLEPANNAKKIVKKKPDTKATKMVSSEENSGISDSESGKEENEDDDVKPRKKSVAKGKKQTTFDPKKRKGEENNLSSKKRVKTAKAASEDDNDTEDNGKHSEDDQSGSLPEKCTKKKEVSTPVYGKRVEHLKSVIKACGMRAANKGVGGNMEEDLKLDKFTLDLYKKLISQQLDEVISSSEVLEPANNAKKIVKKKPDTKATKMVSSEENSGISDSESGKEENEDDDVKPRKKSVAKGKKQTTFDPKKRKGEENNLSSKKRVKTAKAASEDDNDTEDNGKHSEDDQSGSLPEKCTKKKEVSTPVYGKRVEHLKSVIKACGMSIPPTIYKKVKQAPENKREGQLIKELEEILSREGLSSNPSEKGELIVKLMFVSDSSSLDVSCNIFIMIQ
ncbi:hypothetical protein TanjilG_12086 [Lupinus angustifolius]|uniref:Histone chaperone domain-containing protein n=1 Tax=Lupinus angustifolius TaxID=3871 RepID=A0A1J7IJV1_LUPAN|nr:hypothetical protein TanjilG_12086 [Lupinus angustifolius]